MSIGMQCYIDDVDTVSIHSTKDFESQKAIFRSFDYTKI